MKWLSSRRLTIALFVLSLGLGVYLSFFWTPSRPKVAAAGPAAGIAGACAPGSRTGHADLNDGIKTSDRLTIAVRTPSDYDPTRAYPLLVVFPPAGAGRTRRRSENFYDLTTEATRRGFVVAFSDHRGSSPAAAAQQAKVAETVAAFFCIDEKSVSYVGHSDGGTMAEAITADMPKASIVPRNIAASGAGITGNDLAAMPCPATQAVLIVHSRTDEHFPGYGRGSAAYWGRCGGCKTPDLSAAADGCHPFDGCAEGRRVTYCQTSLPHDRWPPMNNFILDFIQGNAARLP
jgi:polyhydroxybutyrate depolymerase